MGEKERMSGIEDDLFEEAKKDKEKALGKKQVKFLEDGEKNKFESHLNETEEKFTKISKQLNSKTRLEITISDDEDESEALEKFENAAKQDHEMYTNISILKIKGVKTDDTRATPEVKESEIDGFNSEELAQYIQEQSEASSSLFD